MRTAILAWKWCHPSSAHEPGAGIINGTSNGIWTDHQELPPLRTLNQTARCKGPIAVVFSTKLDPKEGAAGQPVPGPAPAAVRTPTAELGWSLPELASELSLAAENASAETAGLTRRGDGPIDGSGSRRSRKRAIEISSVKEDTGEAAPLEECGAAHDPVAWRPPPADSTAGFPSREASCSRKLGNLSPPSGRCRLMSMACTSTFASPMRPWCSTPLRLAPPPTTPCSLPCDSPIGRSFSMCTSPTVCLNPSPLPPPRARYPSP